MKGYRKLYIRPSLAELAARRDQIEQDRKMVEHAKAVIKAMKEKQAGGSDATVIEVKAEELE